MKKFSFALFLIMAVLLFSLLFCTVAFAATDTEPPVLVDAFMTKASYAKGENVELVLIFDEPGGIDLNGTYVHFSYENSPTPMSTNVYSGWVNDCVFTNATSTYCATMPQSYYAVKVSIPVAKDGRDYFMSGTYKLNAIFTHDLSNNNAVYGIVTHWGGGGADIPGEAVFTVDNPGADLISPVVKSIAITPAEVNAGETVTVDVTAYDPDGISDVGVTFCCNDFQFYPQDMFQISEVDAKGMTSMRLTMTLPKTMRPGRYSFGQFGIQDKRMNLNCQSMIYPIIDNFDDYGFSVTNDSYVEPGIPTIDEFLMSKQSAKPGDDVTFRVKITENGAEIDDNPYLRVGYSGVTLYKAPDGYYTGTFRIPANWVEQEIHFGMLIYYTDGGNYQFSFSDPGFDLNPILRIESVFQGLDDVTVLKGCDDILSGVSAYNELEKDMTTRITIANPPDFSTPGVYFVRYEIKSNLPGSNENITYIGYRWVGVTEILPETEDDPFVVSNGQFIVDATSNDVSVEVDISGNNDFKEVSFSNIFTDVGIYKLTKLNNDVQNASSASVNLVQAANNNQLICSVINAASRKYIIALNVNGGTSGVMSSFPMTYGIAKALPPNTFSRTGYTFAGWAMTQKGSVKYIDRAIVKNLAAGGTATLYAKWKPKTYTVSYSSQGGSAVESKAAAYNSLITAPASPARAGYIFGGWYKQAVCTTVWNFAADKVSGNTILYAKWTTAPKFMITVQANISTYGTVTGGGLYYNDKITQATITAIPKAGYRFIRWIEGTATASTSYKYSFLVTKARTLKAGFVKISVPDIMVTSAGYNQIKISWASVAGAAGYEVYRATTSSGTYAKVGSTTSSYYTDTGLITNKVYYYKVRLKCVAGTAATYGSFSAYKSAKPIPTTPIAKAMSASYNSIKLTWNAVAGTTRYEVYRAVSSTGTYSLLTTTASTSYTNVSLTTGKVFYYKVRAYHLEGITKVYSGYSAVVNAKPVPAAPALVKAVEVTATSIKVTWASVAGATGYEVYRTQFNTGAYSQLATTTALSYTNTGLTTGKYYYYKVRAYHLEGNVKVYGSFSTIVYAKP